MTKKFDIAVIGAGPGGYVAAIKLAQLGKSVALIEKGFLGGTCLNVGCIPTKTLIASSSLLHQVKKAAEFGIETGPISVAYHKMKARKDTVIEKIRKSLEGLLKSNQITIIQGAAQFESPKELKITGPSPEKITAEKIIIATGSIPIDVPAFPCDHKAILDSTSILELTQIPKSLIIVGGGYIGCEFASLFNELGTDVTILEALPSILALQGTTVSHFMTKAFQGKKIAIQTNVKVAKITAEKQGVTVTLTDGTTLKAEKALVSVGRKPYTQNLHLEKAGLHATERGFLEVNDAMETAVRGIFAIGDVTGKAMLAHVASHQGIVAAMNAAGFEAHVHYDAVPAVIFTAPEVATVGLSLEQAKEKNSAATSAVFPFQAIGKAQASNDTEGFAEIVFDPKYKQILGATLIGHEASNLIAEMALALQNELTLESVVETIHAHPTMAEIWHETAALALGSPIHLPLMKKR
jgi:dihydrolipoamide dehydrogenase